MKISLSDENAILKIITTKNYKLNNSKYIGLVLLGTIVQIQKCNVNK